MNALWLRDTIRQTSLGKSAAGADLWSARQPLTSLGMFAWAYGVTTKYSYYVLACECVYRYIHIAHYTPYMYAYSI